VLVTEADFSAFSRTGRGLLHFSGKYDQKPFELNCLIQTQLSGRFMWPVSKDFYIQGVVRYCISTFASISCFLFWQHLAFKLCHSFFVFDLLGSSVL
jgi:hypothetical protein